jgi:hypothetical protein
MASPPELDVFRQAQLVGGLSQAQWRDNTGLQAIAGRHNRDRSDRDGERRQRQSLHDVYLAVDRVKGPAG